MHTSVNPGEVLRCGVWMLLKRRTENEERGRSTAKGKDKTKLKVTPVHRGNLFTHSCFCLIFQFPFLVPGSFEMSKTYRQMNKVLWVIWCKVLPNIFFLRDSKSVWTFRSVPLLVYPTSLHYSSQWPHLSCFPLALLLKLFIRISQDVSTSGSRNFLLPHHLSIRSCSWPFCFMLRQTWQNIEDATL